MKKVTCFFMLLFVFGVFFCFLLGILVSEASKEFYGAASYQELLNGTFMSFDNPI